MRLARGRDLLHPVESLWRWLLRCGLMNPGSRIGRLAGELHTPFDALERAADAVARGNRKVFEEIGLEFARFLEQCPPDATADSPALRAFLDGLRPGDPPDGQDYLRQAFAHYQRRQAADTPKARAELLLVANLEIGLHEQTRLQPEILAALDAPYATELDLGRRLLELLVPAGSRARRAVPDRPAAAALDWGGRKLQMAGAAISRDVITETLMVLTLPGRVLALGAHLPDPFPESLRELSDVDLSALVARFEPVAPAPDHCGAHDWAVLEQRMHFIVHLFRATQEQADMSRPPFTPAQVERILAGVIPGGDLG
jgi:hypothetical protein